MKMKVAPLAVFSLSALGQSSAQKLLRKNPIDHVEAVEEEAEWFARFVQEVSSLEPPEPPPGPTPNPTPDPTPAPSPAPSAAPTIATPMPSVDPTGACGAIVALNCTYIDPETNLVEDCNELPPIDAVNQFVFLSVDLAFHKIPECSTKFPNNSSLQVTYAVQLKTAEFDIGVFNVWQHPKLCPGLIRDNFVS